MEGIKESVWVKQAWFKVDFIIHEYHIEFKAFRIQRMDERIEQSIIDESPDVEGSIKWDGCMNFTQNSHYCGLYHAYQVMELFKFIYDYGEENMDVL